jgi:crotonobetainyl-CoA:carnitine CoA-transferase CaiB-like acyl-CoA transferase
MGVLTPYRVLDLAGEEGLFCGKILGDLGADVIKIEPVGGDPARRVGPFFHDELDPEKSLFWFAYNTSKRGITLNIETKDGQEIFKRLVKTSDFVIESFHPGYLDKLGLGYSALEKINPKLILVSITPFGQTGPYKDWKAPDIVAWGIGGNMASFGESDRPPYRIGYHSQSYLCAGADAAIGALMALADRNNTGAGQLVDVSIQEAVVQNTEHITAGWDLRKANRSRSGADGSALGVAQKMTRLWPCKDGYVSWFFWGGVMSVRTNVPLVKWMESEGMSDEYLSNYNWENFGNGTTQDEIDRLEAPVAKFFLAHTKKELFEGALRTNTQVYPVSTAADVMADEQLAARKFWVQVDHPELGTKITYPGPFAVSNEAPPEVKRRAPLIGEHNLEIYEGELGFSRQEIIAMAEGGVI